MKLVKSCAALAALSLIGMRPSPSLEAAAADLLARIAEAVLTLFV